MESYPTKYTDMYGCEETVITNDGKTLRMKLRGVEFEGSDFDSFAFASTADTAETRATFAINGTNLCSCSIECSIPIPIVSNSHLTTGTLRMVLELGHQTLRGGLDREVLALTLFHNGLKISGDSKSGFFESELLSIQSKLPHGMYIKACINCLYSDYSPFGSGLFGTMMCFRNVKAAYLKVKSKADFWSVHDHPDRTVQETYLCAEFERRVAGTGYRG